MTENKGVPSVIDAEYYVVESNNKKLSNDIRFGGVIITDKQQRTFKVVVTSVVKSVFYFLLWSVRQLGSLMISGFSGVVDGVKGAAEKESVYDTKYDTKNNFRRRAKSPVSSREKRPMWYIPTKEEEEADRNMRYRYE